MNRLVTLANYLLLAGAWLFAGLGTYASLITGMNPALAFGLLLFWTGLAGLSYRLAFAPRKPARWRKLVPGLFLLLSAVAFHYVFAFFQQRYRPEPDFPHRYYYSQPGT